VITDAAWHSSAWPAEVPAEALAPGEIPRLFTPETFCKLVIGAQREAPKAAV
jgi:hypothetical protein